MGSGLVVNGKVMLKSAGAMGALLEAGQAAASLEELDAVLDGFSEAAEAGALTRVESEAVSRALDRQLSRLERAAAPGGAGAGEGKARGAPTGALEYGQPVRIGSIG